MGYAKAAVAGEPELLRAIGLPDARVVTLEPNWAELVVRFLTNPLVSPLLLSLGILGLVFEIKTGAFGLGGLISLASLGLFFGSSFLVGLAGWEEIILLGVGAGGDLRSRSSCCRGSAWPASSASWRSARRSCWQ